MRSLKILLYVDASTLNDVWNVLVGHKVSGVELYPDCIRGDYVEIDIYEEPAGRFAWILVPCWLPDFIEQRIENLVLAYNLNFSGNPYQ